MKAVISDPKTGKSYQVELDKSHESGIVGKKIGEKIDGGLLGAAGYSLELRGGSDLSGFPMRRDISGPRKISSIISKGVGFRAKMKGIRKKKTLRGNTVSADMVQINLKVIEHGTAPLDELFPKEKKEEKK
ncbi:30S ribosomal protein S6e [Candidatus Micrarchaeota archaeon]|nr:30S ribosomal protein S6e [Candidatus Micrarchaeota archaeon]